MASIDEVLAAANARKTRVRVCLDGDLLDEHARLERELARHLDDGSDEAAVLFAEEIKVCEASIVEATTEFVLQSLGRRAWTDLVAAHPPTEDQRARGADFNPDTLPSAAIAACCVEPTGMTTAKLDELEEVIGFAEWQELWSACLSVNVLRDRLGESVAASAVLERWRQKSEPPSPSASLEASSSDE